MKRFATAITVILMLSLIILPVLAASLDEPISEISPIGTIPAGESVSTVDDYGIAPEHLYPFVYTLSDSFDFFREYVIGPNNCVPGYLYVKDKNSGIITKIYDKQIQSFTETNDFLYCITDDNAIIKLDYSGQSYELLYPASETQLTSLEYYNGGLYFLEGDKVKLYNLATSESQTLFEHSGLLSVFPYNNDQLHLEVSDSNPIIYSISTCQLTVLTDEYGIEQIFGGIKIDPAIILKPDVTVNVVPLITNDISLPITNFNEKNYTDGTYFTTTGNACNHETTRDATFCISYKGMYECMGFAYFASETYAHLPSTGSVVRESGDLYISYTPSNRTDEYDLFSTNTDMREFFSKLTKGAYVRVGRLPRAQDTDDVGRHSFVFVAATENGVLLYDSNYTDDCQISYGLWTYATLRDTYPYLCEYISHSYDLAQSVSTSQHHIKCSHCDGYLVGSHTLTDSPYGGKICSVCGFITGSAIE